MREEFKVTFRTAIILGLSLTLFFIIVWPVILASVQIFSEGLFRWWIALADVWSFTAAIFIIVVPLATEISDMVKQIRSSRGTRRVQPQATNGVTQGAGQGEGSTRKPIVTISEQA